MFRWLVRFSVAALIGALLIWFWNRYNQDLLEEDLEEEIPFEFDVAAEDMPVTLPESASTDAALDAGSVDVAAAEAASGAQATTDAEDAPVAAMDAATGDASGEEQELVLDSPAPTPVGAGDNVIVIKGIGPKYAEKLAEMGITTFGALIGTPLDTLAVAFPRVSGEELENWLEQARELAASSDETA